jgi:hypothetical protein
MHIDKKFGPMFGKGEEEDVELNVLFEINAPV